MSPILLHRFDKPMEQTSVDVLVAFCSTAEFDVRALADEVEEEIARALAPDELIILVRHSGFEHALDAVHTSTQGEALLERLSERTRVEMVGYDGAGSETRREALAVGGMASGVGIEEILRRGATSIFRRRGGFVEASRSYHFANPSGAHTDRFMRLSNILVRQAEIAFLAVSLLRRLPPNARRAYIDTPALYAVVSAINEQWRTLRDDGANIVADNFSSYFGFAEHRFTDIASSVAIISASSSGSLGSKLVTRKGFDPARILHMLYLGPKDPGPGVAIDLRFDEKANPGGYPSERRTFDAADCALCREDSTPIALKGDQFDIAGPQHPPLVIVKKDAPPKLGAAMSRLAGTGALRVSLGTRLFDVDPAALLTSAEYAKRLDYSLSRNVPARLAGIVLVEDAAQPLVDRVLTMLATAATVHRRSDLAALANSGTTFSDPILVVSAVTGSGRLLLDVSRDLRNLAPRVPIIYLVGFAKVQDPVRAGVLNRSLMQTDNPIPHVVEYADELLLPGGPTANPWRDELGFLERNSSVGLAAEIRTRIARLRETSRPLTADLLLPDPGGRTLPLREGFVFWPPALTKKGTGTQADVFFTVASVLQQLRTAPASAGAQAIRTNWMQQTILSPENFGRFNDGIIQACLLRAARPGELDYRDDAEASADVARLVRRILESADRPRGEAAAEFLIAIGTGRIKLCPGDRDAVLAALPGAPQLVSSLLDMCRAEWARGSAAPAAPRRRRRQAAPKSIGKAPLLSADENPIADSDLAADGTRAGVPPRTDEAPG